MNANIWWRALSTLCYRVDIVAASLQFVPKVSEYCYPPNANEDGFSAAVAEVAPVSQRLLVCLRVGARAD